MSDTGLDRVPLEAVPQTRRAQVDSAPGPARLMAARAMLPMDPIETLSVVAYLAFDADPKVAEAARGTPGTLPDTILGPALADPKLHPAVLDYYGRTYATERRIVEPVLLNNTTPDATVEFLARRIEDPVLLDIIGRNQVRYLRTPTIVEALYHNAHTRMGVIAFAIESAARNGVSLAHIPGFKEIEVSILGKRAGHADAADESDEELFGHGVDEDKFQELLRGAAMSDEEGFDADKKSELGKAMWKLVGEMSIAQKVRLAMIGSADARRLLIADSKKVVALSVIKSPKLTEKEIAAYAMMKTVHEDVIRNIARQREWTKNYAVRLALIRNPKTPTQMSITFLKQLGVKDLKHVSRDKDVPGFVMRVAGQVLREREAKGR